VFDQTFCSALYPVVEKHFIVCIFRRK